MKNMKKLMFITTTLYGGGAERVVSNLSSSIAKKGWEVCVVKYYEVAHEYPVSEDVKIINMTGGTLDDYKRISYLEKVRRIRRIIKSEKPDFVIPFLFQVALCTEIASFGLKSQVLQSIRNNPASSPTFNLYRVLRNLLVYKAKCTFVQNQRQKNYFPKCYHHKIHVLFNPVSDDLLAAEWRPEGSEFIVCGIGRLNVQKNFKLLMDAFKKAFCDEKDAVLRIYGQGEEEADLKAYAERTGLGDRIQLMGRSNNIKSVYENTSLFVLSSDFEGMPNALIEAMAVGVPSISTDCPTGPSDLIDDGENGLLVPVGDVEAMAKAMRRVYEKRYALSRMSINAKSKVRKICSADEIAQHMIDIINHAL